MSALIKKYFATLDSGRLDDALALLAEDLEFVMILPGRVNRGSGRAQMLEYLRARPEGVERRHRIFGAASSGDVQFAHGAVVENDSVTTGFFVGVMHVDSAGFIDRYQVSFDPEFSVLPSDFTPDAAQQ